MDRRTRKRLVIALLAVVVLAIALTFEDLRAGVVGGVLITLAILAVTAWSRRRGRHTSWPRASAQLAVGRALVLWKPGCLYCERLLLQLRNDSRITWVNVWRDEEAQQHVRAVNGGDELTPTALIGEDVLRNPTARDLRERLALQR